MVFQKAEDPNKLLDAMQWHEKMIAKLYQTYAKRFEAHADFWNKLSQAEVKHAQCLQHLETLLVEDPDIIIVQRFSIDAINCSIRYINDLIDRSAHLDFDPINAFSLAMKLEEALLEKNYFEILAGDSYEVKETLSFLLHETEQHYQILKQALLDYRASR